MKDDPKFYQPDLVDIRAALVKHPDIMKELSGATILLTGACGFLGRWLVRTFQELNTDLSQDEATHLICVDAVASDVNFLDKNTEFIHHDLTDKRLDVSESLDYVIHAAGIASPYWYQKFPKRTFDVAVKGSEYCLDLASKNDARYLFCSSSEVYQTADIVPTPESYTGAIPSMGVRSCYDVSKLAGETLAHIYSEETGVDTVVVRIFNSFGAGMSQKDYRVLPRLAAAMKHGESFPVIVHHGGARPYGAGYNPGEPTQPQRTYCPVANTVVGLITALIRGKPDEVYNVGTAWGQMTTQELVERAADVAGVSPRFHFVQATGPYAYEPMKRGPDTTKLRGLGFEDPVVSTNEGLRRFLTWALETYE